MLELWVVDFVSLPAHVVENRLLLDFGQVVLEPPLQQTPSPKHLPPLDVTPDKVACDKGNFLMGLYRYEACIGVYKPGKAVIAARMGPEGGES